MRLSNLLALTLGCLSLAACSGFNDSLGKHKNNQGTAGNGGSPTCEGPDPSATCNPVECAKTSGYSCQADSCKPSSCSCTKDGWQCTADCGQGSTCKKDGSTPSCNGPDPSAACDPVECAKTSGYSCQADSCKPSSCSCTKDGWQCTADCGQGSTCKKDGSTPSCNGPDPSAPCDPNECGKSQGYSCQADNCKPSSCACTKDGWQCTADCGQGISCLAIPQKCNGPDPSAPCDAVECKKLGLICQADSCKPSSCVCGKNGWQCTADCGQGLSCK